MRFDGRVAIVTGSGDGLGRAHALWLAERGAAVVVSNRRHPDRASSANAVVDEIKAQGGRAVAHEQSVEESSAAANMVKVAIETFGRIDIVICNAAVTLLAPFDQSTLEDFHKVVDVNLWGTVNLVHAAWKHMIGQGYGRVVLTTSTGGTYGVVQSAPYSTTKASLIGFARAIGFDVPQGADIKVNVIAPSANTKMLKGWVSEKMGAALEIKKVCPVVGWLASEQCQDTGMVLFAAAGKVARIRVVESNPVDVVEDMSQADWGTLNAMTDLTEPKDVFASLLRLLPEGIK